MEEENTKEKPVRKLGRLSLEMIEDIGSLHKSNKKEQPDDFVKLIAHEKNFMQPPKFDMNAVKTIDPSVFASLAPVNLTMSQIKNMTNEELIKTLTGELNPRDNRIADASMQLINNELLIRQIKDASKPHWTVKPTFYTVVFFGLITIIIGILSLLRQQ